IWIVFNGEIYNYPALRRDLIDLGHRFRTNSDTEVIVHLYEQYGVDAIKRLRGMFTFAIWDDTRRRLLLARDPMGQKHLYYQHTPASFRFASEMKALFADGVTRELNPAGMNHLLSLRCIPAEETLFAGIHKLPAGHWLLFEEGEVSIRRYWELNYEPKREGTEAELIDELHGRLVETIQSHMISDVPLGAFLSGGIDSSLITAIMATHSPTPIKTFSIGVREDDFNELPYARMVAQQYKTDHHEYVVEPNLVTQLPDMLHFMEEPVDPFAFGVYSVSKLASQHVKVVLGGDGGDEMFAGYDRYLGNQLVDLYCLLPGALRAHLVEPLIKRLPDNFSYNNRVAKLRWLVAMSDSSAGERYAQSASFLRFGYAHKQALYSSLLWDQVGNSDSVSLLARYFDLPNASDPIDKMLFTDVKTRLADHLLMVGDRMTMAHSLEGRSPYVDHQLGEFIATMPASLKLKGRHLKHALREVSRRYLPEALVERPKRGFSFPLAYWFKTDLLALTDRLFCESRLAQAGYFRADAMRALLQEHASGAVDHNYRLWLLLNMELWYRLFVVGESKEALKVWLLRAQQGMVTVAKTEVRASA
ncbi:MAG: asparagine synthase (glutamine-hydrolyzing), partial [Anaerolinea sp.]|nr:asparagine synthase (glutamine-hydrolyzing) [Anaerolinea sp.]